MVCVTDACERWCVTKMCVKYDVWQSCVWQMVGDKLCVTKLCVCDKVVCERWLLTKMCERWWCEKWCATKLWNMVVDKDVCDRGVCERWWLTKMCVKDGGVKNGVWQNCETWWLTKMGGGDGGRGGLGYRWIQNQKQEPHTKMWGIRCDKIWWISNWNNLEKVIFSAGQTNSPHMNQNHSTLSKHVDFWESRRATNKWRWGLVCASVDTGDPYLMTWWS